MENINIEQIENNTYFISDRFYVSGAHSISGTLSIDIDRIDYLQQSIKIIESGQYSKYELKQCLLYPDAYAFWNDLFYMRTYEEAKIIIENSIKTGQAEFDTHPGKDDILLQDSFNRFMEQKRQNIDNLITIIELTNEFRELLQVQIPDLETEFNRLLTEYNDRQPKNDNSIVKVNPMPTWAKENALEKIWSELLNLKWVDEKDKINFFKAFGVCKNSEPFVKVWFFNATRLAIFLMLMRDGKTDKLLSDTQKVIANNLFSRELKKNTNINKTKDFDKWSKSLPITNKLRKPIIIIPEDAGSLAY